MCGDPLGKFSPDCPESLTPGACASEGSLSSGVVLYRLNREPGWLRYLRAILLDRPLLFIAITSPSSPGFLWAFFRRLFQSRSNSHAGASVFCLALVFLPIFSTII